jgi:hypothetical protein
MAAIPVSTAVNTAGTEGRELIEPIDPSVANLSK